MSTAFLPSLAFRPSTFRQTSRTCLRPQISTASCSLPALIPSIIQSLPAIPQLPPLPYTVSFSLFVASLPPYLLFLHHTSKPPFPSSIHRSFLLLFLFPLLSAPLQLVLIPFRTLIINHDPFHFLSSSFLLLSTLHLHHSFHQLLPSSRSSHLPIPLFSLLLLPLLPPASPPQALSFPTWAVHVGIALSFLTTIRKSYRFSEISGIPNWDLLTNSMYPAFGAATAACVYHFVMNRPDWQMLLVLQAGLTAISNCMMAYAGGKIREEAAKKGQTELVLKERENGGEAALINLMGYAVVGAAVCKWGSEWLVGKMDMGVEWGVVLVVLGIIGALAYGEGGLLNEER